MTATRPQTPASKTLGQRVQEIRQHYRAQPGLDYQLLRIIIFSLIGIGVLMAFSASMATSFTETSNVWAEAIRQCLLVFGGLVLFWLALRISPYTLRKLVPWLLLLSILLLIAVLIPGIGTGRDTVGSQSWISIGSVGFQPSEFARVTVAMYGATALAGKSHRSLHPTDPFMMYSIISGLMFFLIVAQGDLGMAVSFAMVVVFTLIFAGVDWRVPAVVLVLGTLGLLAVFLSGGFRSHRFHTYFDAIRGNIEDTQGTGFQAYQGFLSLADGGFWGVGLGQSRAKWFYLPEAKNDFVFAIIGEELGLWGGVLVIFLFAALGYIGLRTAKNAQDQFQSLLAATLTVGVVIQAFINIGYVIGLLPVTGIQLPMISAGGTAALITIGSMGVLCNVARHEPLQISAMQNFGRPLFDRLFFIPEPQLAGDAPKRKTGRHASPTPAKRGKGQSGVVGQLARRNAEREERFGRPVTSRQPRAGENNTGSTAPRGEYRQRGADRRDGRGERR